MTIKERMLCALHKERTDKIPWARISCSYARGYVEREARNKGCGLLVYMRAWRMSMPDVTVAEKQV